MNTAATVSVDSEVKIPEGTGVQKREVKTPAEKGKKGVISAKKTRTIPQNNNLTPLDQQLLGVLDAVEQQEKAAINQEKSFDFKPHIRCLLALKSSEKCIAGAYKDSSFTKTEFSENLLNSIELYTPNEPIKAAKFAEITSRRQAQKIMQLLQDIGLLIQESGNNYRWASSKELQKLTCKTAQICNVLFGKNLIDSTNKQINRWRIQRSLNDPYATVNDNEITKHRKPFTGELTEKEKAIIRQHDEEQAIKKLTTDAGVSLEARQRITAIKDKANIEKAQREARWIENTDRFWQYTKALGLLGLLIFVFSIISKGCTPQSSGYSYETNISLEEAIND